jgi:S-DNA-T family DNA segregation ATPase FtsK/SpoIIIE
MRLDAFLAEKQLAPSRTRAAKLIDRMQAEGYVTPPDGSKPRSVLITPEQYMEKFVDNPSGEE